jgi:hypothetical protein
VITDLNMLGNNINNSEFLVVVAVCDKGEYMPHPNIYNISSLQPSTNILMRWADCNDPMSANAIMNSEYRAYLSMEDNDEIIVSMLAALCKKDVFIYIPQSTFEIFGPVLIDHIYQMYGVMAGFNFDGRFFVNINMQPRLLTKLYAYNFMDSITYLESYPTMINLPVEIISKLITDMRPNIGSGRPISFDQYMAYFNDLNRKTTPTIDMPTMVNFIGDKK